MGHCRIRIVIAKDLLSKERQKEIQILAEKDKEGDVILSETATAMSWVRIFSADTTVREVAEGTPDLWKLYIVNKSPSSLLEDLPFQLWDCTIHPPTDITDWPTKTFLEVMGPKSKTLHDAGCFPSGTWMVLPRGVTPRKFNKTNYEDAQYNKMQQLKQQQGLASSASGKLVEFKDPSLAASKPLPSQVMASVTKRFEDEDVERAAQAQQARTIRLENQEQLRKRQQERVQKLDRRIQQLEDQSSEKNKKVSEQVRRMLVKSRATGDKRLKLQDRLYFECLLDRGSDNDDDEALVREFRYFSPQDTFAKIASSFEGPGKQRGEMNLEVLVKRKVGDGSTLEEYRRFPVAMRVYEATAEKFLTGDQVDTLIIRWFASDGGDASPSILEVQEDKPASIPGGSDDVEMADATVSKDTTPGDPKQEERVESVSSSIVDETMTLAIRAMDEINNKGKKPKKASAAAIKVRNMQIKSKAKGDAKRIPKVEDRFFLEVIQLGSGGAGKASSSFQFLSNKDPLERIIQSVASSSNTTDWDFFVPVSDGESMTYRKISDTSIELADAAAKAILKPFDRLIMRPK
jgi:hypothetical protein